MRKAFILLLLLTPVSAFAGDDMSPPDVGAIMRLPKNPYEEEGKKWAAETQRDVWTPEFDRRVKEEQNRMVGTLSGGGVGVIGGKTSTAADVSPLKEEEKVYVFISSSMPMETVRRYAASLAPFGRHGALVMMGMKGGLKNMREHVSYMFGVLAKDEGCRGSCPAWPVQLLVDQRLFSRFGVEKVPAIVYARGGDPLGPAGGEFWGLFGDTSLKGALWEINEVAGSEGLSAWLRQ